MSPVALVYILLVGVFAPAMAVRGARRVRGTFLPPRSVLFRGVLLSYAVLGLLSWLTTRALGLPWFAVRPLVPRDAAWVLGALALLLAWLPISWRTRPAAEKRRLLSLVPTTGGQAALWIAVSAGAGFFEEIAWRGVLYVLVLGLVRERWVAAALCSISFGISHSYQGGRSMISTGLIALLQHAIVFATGSLVPAMIVHFTYDAIAGFVIAALARRDEARETAGAA